MLMLEWHLINSVIISCGVLIKLTHHSVTTVEAELLKFNPQVCWFSLSKKNSQHHKVCNYSDVIVNYVRARVNNTVQMRAKVQHAA